MRRKASLAAVLVCVAVLVGGRPAAGEDPRYSLKVGENSTYEIVVKAELPSEIDTQFSYLIIRPQSVDAATGQMTLGYSWGIKVNQIQSGGRQTGFSFGSLAPMFREPAEKTFRVLVIDALGAIVDDKAVKNDAQLDSMQGPAWRLVLQPLPPQGQTTWKTNRQIKVARTERSGSFGPAGFGPPGGFGGPMTRVETIYDENVTYTAAPPQGRLLTIQRQYDLTSTEKAGDSPVEHLHGQGVYVFDMDSGRVATLAWKLTDDFVGNNVTAKVPITVTAKLLSDEEVAKIRSDLEAQAAKAAEAASRGSGASSQPAGGNSAGADARARIGELRSRREHSNLDVNNLPDGMEATEVMGATTGGGPFVAASNERQPVIGFRLQTTDFGGRRCFRIFEPLYEKPEGPPEKNTTILLAKDGYAVGALTINSGEFVNAICVSFMKRTDPGLDPKTAYQSPWFGKRGGPTQRTLGGNGQLVYGIFGRKGLNVDAIGLVMEAQPGDISGK